MGHMKDDMRHCHGKLLLFETGDCLEGEWREDELVKEDDQDDEEEDYNEDDNNDGTVHNDTFNELVEYIQMIV